MKHESFIYITLCIIVLWVEWNIKHQFSDLYSHSGLDRTLYIASLHSGRMAIRDMWNIQPIVGMYTYPSRNGNQGFVGYLKCLWGYPHHHRISIKYQISPPVKCRDAMYSVRHNATWPNVLTNNSPKSETWAYYHSGLAPWTNSHHFTFN
jgi:hypothetical protein